MFINPQEQMFFQKASEYLSGLVTLDELHEFSLMNVNEFLDSPDQVVVKLVNEIESSVVEIQEGLQSEQDFKKSLEKILAEAPSLECSLGGSVATNIFENISFCQDILSANYSTVTYTPA